MKRFNKLTSTLPIDKISIGRLAESKISEKFASSVCVKHIRQIVLFSNSVARSILVFKLLLHKYHGVYEQYRIEVRFSKPLTKFCWFEGQDTQSRRFSSLVFITKCVIFRSDWHDTTKRFIHRLSTYLCNIIHTFGSRG